MIATLTELAAFLRVEAFTAGPEEDAATLALELAEGTVKAELAQAIDRVTDDELTLDGSGGYALLLPELPVIDVTGVAVRETIEDAFSVLTADSDYVVELGIDGRRGVIRRVGTRWPADGGSIVVTYSHGYDTAGDGYGGSPTPAGLKAVVLRLAARGYANPLQLTQETVGRWSGTYSTAGGIVTAADRMALDPWRPGRRS